MAQSRLDSIQLLHLNLLPHKSFPPHSEEKMAYSHLTTPSYFPKKILATATQKKIPLNNRPTSPQTQSESGTAPRHLLMALLSCCFPPCSAISSHQQRDKGNKSHPTAAHPSSSSSSSSTTPKPGSLPPLAPPPTLPTGALMDALACKTTYETLNNNNVVISHSLFRRASI